MTRGNLAGRMERAEQTYQELIGDLLQAMDRLLAEYETFLQTIPPALLAPGFDFDAFEQVFTATLTAGGYDESSDPGTGLRLKMHAWNVAAAAAMKPQEMGR